MLLDKDKVLEFLAKSEMGAISHAFSAKPHIAVKAYAQAAAFKYILDLVLTGEFDLVPEDRIIN